MLPKYTQSSSKLDFGLFFTLTSKKKAIVYYKHRFEGEI